MQNTPNSHTGNNSTAVATDNSRNELVLIEKGQVFTTSRIIADKFGKRHADVLRTIQMLERVEDFSERNFALADYIDAQGKVRREYHLTKDGTAFLIMGFTGPQAAKFKVEFINAFNAMELKLKAKPTRPKRDLSMDPHQFLMASIIAIIKQNELHRQILLQEYKTASPQRKMEISAFAYYLLTINWENKQYAEAMDRNYRQTMNPLHEVGKLDIHIAKMPLLLTSDILNELN